MEIIVSFVCPPHPRAFVHLFLTAVTFVCTVDTYGEFVDENEELLKKLPPSPVAVHYYENEDLYLYEYENCLCLFSAIYLVNYWRIYDLIS